MFYVVILFFSFWQPGARVWGTIVFVAGIRSLGAHCLWYPGAGGHRLWQPEAGIREALIYFLEYHCTTSWEIKLKPSLVGREISSIR